MLKNDLKLEKNLIKVFNYVSLEENKQVFDEQLWYLLNEPRFEGQVAIVQEIEWLFFTANDNYVMIGVNGKDVWSIDGDGFLTKAHFDLANAPFYIFENLTNELDSFKDYTLFHSFMYYFDYCNKNNIELLPENLLWKKQIQDFLDNNP